MSLALKIFFLSIVSMVLMVVLARGGDGYRQENYGDDKAERLGRNLHATGVIGFALSFLAALVSVTIAIVQA